MPEAQRNNKIYYLLFQGKKQNYAINIDAWRNVCAYLQNLQSSF